ncbi:CWF complex protein sap62, partial [Coemansia helicoidea]
GKKHQASLARRAARDARDAEAAPARTGAGAGAGAATASRVRRTVVKIGRPGYKVTKIRDPQARQLGLLFEVTYPEVTEETKPRHRFMSAFEQHVEPPNSQYQYLLFAADPYETIAFKVQSREVDMRPGRFWSHWDPDTRKFTLQLFFRSPARGPPGPDASGTPTGANAVPTGTRINPLDPYLAPQQTARG